MNKSRAFKFEVASKSIFRFALLITVALAFLSFGAVALKQNYLAAESSKGAPKSASESHRLVAAYYSVVGELKATLMLSNQGPGTIPARIRLFSKNGAQNNLLSITLNGHEVRALDLRQYIQPGSGFEEGSLEVEYQGKFLELGGLVNMVDAEQSLSFEEELSEPAKAFASTRLEGVYWLPNNNTEIALALSNTGSSRLTVSVSATGNGQNGSNIAVTLSPRETRVLSSEGGQGNQVFKFQGTAGGISINHSGQPGDLVAFGHIREAAKGFSNVIDFVDPQKSKSSRLDGAGLRFGSVAGQPLAQAAVVRNIGNAPVSITGRMPYTTVDGNQHVTNLPTLQLSPGEVKKLNLNLPSSIEVAAAGLEFISSGQPGSIIAAALSHSANRNQVFRVPMRDATMQASSTGHYPWSIDESSATVVYIKNATDTERDFTLHVGYEGGYYTLGVTTIQAGQTKLFDVRQLRDSQQPDSNGRVIPLTTQRGQVHWSVRGPETRTLIGRAEQANLTAGISMTSACGVCCPDSFQYAWLTPGSVTGHPGSTTQFLAFRQDRDCYQFIWEYQWAYPYGWSCDNTSVATVNTSGFATAGGVGSTWVRNVYSASEYYENIEECIVVPVSANAAASCTVQQCTIQIIEETISPGTVSPPNPSLPLRNPARIRQGFAPVFEATLNPASCPVTWSVVSGPGSIVGSTTNRLVTVNGNSVGSVILQAIITGQSPFAQITVPVVNITNVNVRAYIVRRNDGTGAATTTARVNSDIADANLIWQQCGITLNLVSTTFINNTTYLTPNATQREMLRNTNTNTGGFEIYYVDSFPDSPGLGGANTINGIVIGDLGNTRTAAHELGHAFGLPHRGIADVSLMWDFTSSTKADLILNECTSLSNFSHN